MPVLTNLPHHHHHATNVIQPISGYQLWPIFQIIMIDEATNVIQPITVLTNFPNNHYEWWGDQPPKSSPSQFPSHRVQFLGGQLLSPTRETCSSSLWWSKFDDEKWKHNTPKSQTKSNQSTHLRALARHRCSSWWLSPSHPPGSQLPQPWNKFQPTMFVPELGLVCQQTSMTSRLYFLICHTSKPSTM